MIPGMITFIAVTFLGRVLILPFSDKFSFWGRLGLSYGLGMGFVTYGAFVISALGMPLTTSTWFLLYILELLVSLAVMMRWGRKLHWKSIFELPKLSTCSPVSWILLVFLLLTVGGVFFLGLYWPIRIWDAIAIWGAKARGIHALQSVRGSVYGAYPSRPLNVPLSMTLMLSFGAESIVKLPLLLNFAALLAVFQAGLNERIRSTTSLAFTLTLAATPFLFREASKAYADVTLAFYLTVSVILLHRWLCNSEDYTLWLSGLMAGLAGWTKTEGLMLVALNLIVLAVIAVRRRVYKPFLIYLVLSTSFGLLWFLYANAVFESSPSKIHILLQSVIDLLHLKIDRGAASFVMQFAREQIFNLNLWGVAFYLFGLSIVLCVLLRATEARLALLTIALMNFGAILFLYYSLSALQPDRAEWWLKTGFNRLALHFVPILIFFAGDVVGSLQSGTREISYS